MSTVQFIPERMVAEVEYLGQGPATDTGGSSATMDFSDVDFGDAEQGRVIAIEVFWSSDGSSRSIVSATINGETAQIDQQQFVTGTLSRLYTGIISALVSEDTSGPVQITFSGSIQNHLEIHIHRMVGLVEYPTVVDADNDQASGSGDTSLFLQAKAGGAVIGCALARNAGNAFTLTGITEDFDQNIFGADFRKAGGSAAIMADDAAYEVRFQNSQNNGAVVAVSYR